MRQTLTISLPEEINAELERIVKEEGRSKSEVVREALRRQLAVRRFRALREKLVPKGQAAGIFTDEDVFKIVS